MALQSHITIENTSQKSPQTLYFPFLILSAPLHLTFKMRKKSHLIFREGDIKNPAVGSQSVDRGAVTAPPGGPVPPVECLLSIPSTLGSAQGA